MISTLGEALSVFVTSGAVFMSGWLVRQAVVVVIIGVKAENGLES